MKRALLGSLFLGVTVALVGACGGSSNNNNGTGVVLCNPGQVCVGGLAPGMTVNYQGPFQSVVDSQAFILAQAFHGNGSNSNITFQNGGLRITASGLPNGGTNYAVYFEIDPHNTSGFNTCVSPYPDPNICYYPIIVQGNAAYGVSSSNAQVLQVVISPGLRLNIIANTGSSDNAFNGTQVTLSNVIVNLVKNGQDPIVGGDLLARVILSKY